jgi:pimeloyl-ACP methyl ester carboxylesterase
MHTDATAVGGRLAAQITCPVLIVRGEHSEVMPADGVQLLRNQLGAKYVQMNGRYHHLPLEGPGEFASIVCAGVQLVKAN